MPSPQLDSSGTLGDSNRTWRFDWPMVGQEPGRVLGLLTAASGRGRFDLLGVGVPEKKPPPASY